MDDSALVAAIARKDPSGLDGAYRRYADPLHAYAWSLTGDRDTAADVVHDTFLLASQHVTQLRDPARFRQWLYSIARHEGFRQIKRRSRHMSLDPEFDLPADTVDLTAKAHSADVAELVRAAFHGMSESDKEVAELTVRHGMSASDIALMLGISPNHAHARLSRAREQLTISLAALLVARHGRAACAELNDLLSGWDGQLTPLLRKRITRHTESCQVCDETRKRRFNPTALLAGFGGLPFAAIPELRRTSSDAAADGSDRVFFGPPAGRPVPPAPRWERQHGFPRQHEGRKRVLPIAVTGAAAALLLVIGGGVLYLQRPVPVAAPMSSPTPSELATSAPPSPSPTPSASPSPTPSRVTVTSAPPRRPPRTSAPPPPPPALTLTAVATCKLASTGNTLNVTATANVNLSTAKLIYNSPATTVPKTPTGKQAVWAVTWFASPSFVVWHVEVKDIYGRTKSSPTTTTPCNP